jgi:hypothetical protein
LKAQDGSPLQIGAGMMAEVDVLGHKRSVFSYSFALEMLMGEMPFSWGRSCPVGHQR